MVVEVPASAGAAVATPEKRAHGASAGLSACGVDFVSPMKRRRRTAAVPQSRFTPTVAPVEETTEAQSIPLSADVTTSPRKSPSRTAAPLSPKRPSSPEAVQLLSPRKEMSFVTKDIMEAVALLSPMKSLSMEAVALLSPNKPRSNGIHQIRSSRAPRWRALQQRPSIQNRAAEIAQSDSASVPSGDIALNCSASDKGLQSRHRDMTQMLILAATAPALLDTDATPAPTTPRNVAVMLMLAASEPNAESSVPGDAQQISSAPSSPVVPSPVSPPTSTPTATIMAHTSSSIPARGAKMYEEPSGHMCHDVRDHEEPTLAQVEALFDAIEPPTDPTVAAEEELRRVRAVQLLLLAASESPVPSIGPPRSDPAPIALRHAQPAEERPPAATQASRPPSPEPIEVDKARSPCTAPKEPSMCRAGRGSEAQPACRSGAAQGGVGVPKPTLRLAPYTQGSRFLSQDDAAAQLGLLQRIADQSAKRHGHLAKSSSKGLQDDDKTLLAGLMRRSPRPRCAPHSAIGGGIAAWRRQRGGVVCDVVV